MDHDTIIFLAAIGGAVTTTIVYAVQDYLTKRAELRADAERRADQRREH